MTSGARPAGFVAIVSGWVILLATTAAAQTGTFIDRHLPTDLRLMSYNVLWDTIFPSVSASQSAKFARVIQALDPDILNLQEINSPFDPSTSFSAVDVRNLMNTIRPLDGGATWHAYMGSTNVIVSKYPLSMTQSDTRPSTLRGMAMALVDLPDAVYPADFYVMNNHFKCCGNPGGPEDSQRQRHADALVGWMHDARNPGGFINLPANTPMAVVGDLNIVGLPDPLTNLKTGNIVDEGTFGADSPPDWDGTALADAHPRHNFVGPDYTWREDGSGFAPGRLDYILYTNSVVDVANHFLLNTVMMSSAERAATGLQQNDVLKYSAGWYDHLPLVVDFRFAVRSPGDFNFDGTIDESDYDVWKLAYGGTNAAADANGDGVVDAADYTVWRNNVNTEIIGSGGFAAVPEPASCMLLLPVCAALMVFRVFPGAVGRS
jgi:endonuclease/exonuclease/phosphatase family metal-dependent hydrolase